MKQKNYGWIYYLVGAILIVGILVIAFQDITPVSHHVEQTVATDSIEK